jgi:hypothetical protein
MAIDTLSASSTSSATSGLVSTGSGSHSPTYSSRCRASVRSRLRQSRVTIRTRYARGSRTSQCSASTKAAHRNQVSCTTSSASATEPSIS